MVAEGVATGQGDWFFKEIIADGAGEDTMVWYKSGLFLFLHFWYYKVCIREYVLIYMNTLVYIKNQSSKDDVNRDNLFYFNNYEG